MMAREKPEEVHPAGALVPDPSGKLPLHLAGSAEARCMHDAALPQDPTEVPGQGAHAEELDGHAKDAGRVDEQHLALCAPRREEVNELVDLAVTYVCTAAFAAAAVPTVDRDFFLRDGEEDEQGTGERRTYAELGASAASPRVRARPRTASLGG